MPLTNLPFQWYEKIIEKNWLTSVWSYAHSANIIIDIEDQWLPEVAREGDSMLMDLAMNLNLSTLQLKQINAFRLYLQVLTISDISTATGSHILSNIIRGRKTEDRLSRLHWPATRRPTSWVAWKLLLQHLSSGGRLDRRLGPWRATPHQQWSWYYNPTLSRVYHRTGDNEWIQNERTPQNRLTRCSYNTYYNPIPCQTPALDQCFPTTVTQRRNCIVSRPSTSPFMTPTEKNYHKYGSEIVCHHHSKILLHSFNA
jgi:hypothetical protein